MDWDAMAVVGRIARAHGIRGQVIVNLETDFPDERFRPGATVFAERGGTITPLTLTTVRFQRGRPVIGVQGVETMNDAEQLAGLELRVPIDALVPLPTGTFYHHDLVGCRVVTGSGEDVGAVESVEGTFGGSRLVVRGASGEILIPLATDICRTIDVAGKRIVIDPPEGLLDLNR
ncbi:MAG TPA: ribosome maturation factor RimM [Vicinamibacterales bacterium]|nr:ribosome maturation factor RimM [Vicinamibacterales bacterium]